jgi:hypothetical protein
MGDRRYTFVLRRSYGTRHEPIPQGSNGSGGCSPTVNWFRFTVEGYAQGAVWYHAKLAHDADLPRRNSYPERLTSPCRDSHSRELNFLNLPQMTLDGTKLKRRLRARQGRSPWMRSRCPDGYDSGRAEGAFPIMFRRFFRVRFPSRSQCFTSKTRYYVPFDALQVVEIRLSRGFDSFRAWNASLLRRPVDRLLAKLPIQNSTHRTKSNLTARSPQRFVPGSFGLLSDRRKHRLFLVSPHYCGPLFLEQRASIRKSLARKLQFTVSYSTSRSYYALAAPEVS